jgi:hypothetical protein
MQNQSHSIADEVQFNTADLDKSIEDSGVYSSIPIEAQRAVAAYSMLAFALAMSIRDDSQYQTALSELTGTPTQADEASFFIEFGQVLVREINDEMTLDGFDLSAFTQRAEAIVANASAQCH